MTEARDALRSLVAMLPELEADGASFGVMVSPERVGDVISMPWFEFNETGELFHSLGYAVGVGLTADDWEAWEREGKEEAFLADYSRIASASLLDIQRLIVTIVRRERFCDGAVQTALEVGLVGAVVRRAAALMPETERR